MTSSSVFSLLNTSNGINNVHVYDLSKLGNAISIYSLGAPVSSTNKTDCHNIAEILLKAPLSGVKHHNPNPTLIQLLFVCYWHVEVHLVFNSFKQKLKGIIYLTEMICLFIFLLITFENVEVSGHL
jgi:hypothetical protein